MTYYQMVEKNLTNMTRDLPNFNKVQKNIMMFLHKETNLKKIIKGH